MAFRRVTTPSVLLHDDELTRAMASIGMRFAVEPVEEANIEDTLLAASVEGMEADDLRVLSVLVTWIDVHRMWINADRLTRLVEEVQSKRVQAFWAAIATWLQKDRRFSRIKKLYDGPRVDLLFVGTKFQVLRKGEDPHFQGSVLRVPAATLRDRKRDVLAPVELVIIHSAYRHRIMMGPTYRADMWAALAGNPTLSASELARVTYGSFATAWQVRQAFTVIQATHSTEGI